MAKKANISPPVTVNGITLPADPIHQRIADTWLKTGEITAAAKAAGVSRIIARNALKRPDVQHYIAALRERLATEEFLSMEEIRRFTARLLRSKISDLDPYGKTGDLISDFEETDTDTGTRRKIKKYDPFKWVELDLRLSGDDPQQDALTQLINTLNDCAHQGLPKDKM